MLTAESTVWTDFIVEPSVDDILRAQGADPAKVRARGTNALEVAQEALDIGRALVRPQAVLRSYSVTSVRHHALLLTGGRLSGDLVARRLSGASEVVAIVCTIGPALEHASRDSFDTDPALAVALDSLGSVAVERVTSAVRQRVRTEATARGLEVTAPLTPGDLEWTVDAGQPQVFALVQAERIGVSLSPSSMMEPRKSSSMVLGLGPDVLHDARDECERCDMSERCRFRPLHETLAAQ